MGSRIGRISWNANSEPDLAGYRVYWGTTISGQYQNSVDVGNVTNMTLGPFLDSKRVYAAISAYDTSGNESALSVEVDMFYSVPPDPATMTCGACLA